MEEFTSTGKRFKRKITPFGKKLHGKKKKKQTNRQSKLPKQYHHIIGLPGRSLIHEISSVLIPFSVLIEEGNVRPDFFHC